MKKSRTERAIIFSLICLIIGVSLLTLGYCLGGRPGVWIDRSGMHSNRESREQKEVSMPKTRLEPLQSAVFDVRHNDVTFLPSEDDSWYLEYKMSMPVRSRNPSYELREGCLTFSMEEEEGRESGAVMGFFVVSEDSRQKGYVNLYAPAGAQMKEVRVSNSEGNIKIVGITADSMDIEGGYGKAALEKISAGKLSVSLSDGDIKCSEIEADNADIRIAYGGLDGDDIRAKEMKLLMADGSCRLTQLDIVTGDIDQKYGDVELHLKGRQEDYNYDLETQYGSIELNGEKVKKSEQDGELSYYRVTGGEGRSLTARSSDGKLVIRTEQ